jgi:hypothetical protein
MRRLLALLATAGSVALAAPATAVACSCVGPMTEAEHRRDADVVFVGRVERVAHPGPGTSDPARARLRVQRVIKGRLGARRVTVETARDEAGCGVTFQRGARFRVYAEREAGGGLSTGLCSGTRRVATAATACDSAT